MPDPGKFIEQAIGQSAKWTVIAKDATGAVVTQYDNSNDLTCEIWAGLDQGPLATPVAAWVDPTLGEILITITSSDMDALTVGEYRLQVWVTNDDLEPVLIIDGGLIATASPGVATPLTVDITYEDLTLYVPQIRTLKDFDFDLSGFANQRHEAQLWFRDQIVDRYRPQVGRSRRYMNAAGSAAGSVLVYAPSPLGSWDPPSGPDIQGYMDAGGMILTESIKQCQAHYAASEIYLGQPGRDNLYQQAGAAHLQKAMAQFNECIIELDTDDPLNDPLVPAIRIDRDVIYLT